MPAISNVAFKTASVLPINAGNEVIYTMPALTTGVALSAIATTNAGVARNAFIGVQPSGSSVVTPIVNNVGVSTASSVNLLTGKVSLNAGDRIVTNSNNATVGYNARPAGDSPYPTVPTVLLSNPSGSIICAHCGTAGIWTSTDGGVTATRTATASLVAATGVYFLGAFHFYESATSKRTSTDGVTWNTVACTLAPINRYTATGGVIVVGATAYSVNAGQVGLISTTDGTTWAAFGVNIPSGAMQGFCWTGTRWVVGSSTADTVYSSTNAAAWTAATGLSSAQVTTIGGVANIGSTVVVNQNGSVWASVNDGQAFVSSPASATAASIILSTASGFMLAQSGPAEALSANGLTGTWTNTGSANGGFGTELTTFTNSPWVITSSKILSIKNQSTDLAFTRRGGLGITLSVMEVS